MKISPTASYFKFLFSPSSLYRHSLMCMAQCLCSLCSYICIQSNVPNVLLLYKWHLVSWIFDLLLTVLYHKRNNFWVQLNSYMCMPFTCSKQWKRHVMYNCKNNQNKLKVSKSAIHKVHLRKQSWSTLNYQLIILIHFASFG